MTPRYPRDTLPADPDGWEFLPFRFLRTDDDTVLVTNLVGEHLILTTESFERFAAKVMPTDPVLRARLRGKHMVRRAGEELPLELLAMKLRTRFHRLAQFTSLHIFVVTLRCEHACRYCQVSRQNSGDHRYDMAPETAQRALDMVFRSPAPAIKIEFQGGEPLLNFGLVEQIVTDAEVRNQRAGKDLSFVIATNLALLDDRVLSFAAAHHIDFSTSLDGPEDLHNRNRPRPGGDSWQRTISGIRRIQSQLGADRVAALMTTTEASLERVREIIDCYVDHDLRHVFLRPISPYGFAIRTKSHAAYDTARWLAFYEVGLNYILELNHAGIPIVEQYAALILTKMLTNQDPGYVDLTSPAGIGIGGIVYNYDADVYASDEGRMLAEMGDTTFRLGNLHHDTYTQLMTGDALLGPLEESFAFSSPMCTDCAFECYCGADPVYHHTTTGDFLGRKPESAFCTRNMTIFKLLLHKYQTDSHARAVFHDWAGR